MRLVAVGATAAIAAAACRLQAPPAPQTEDILKFRAAKDEAFRTDPDSPIPVDAREALLPLAYYPVDSTFVAPASLRPPGPGEAITISMPTSTGKMRRMRRAGTLEFFMLGQSLSLAAFVEADSADANRLFVPFSDLTSGTETYAGGRYLDLDRTPTGIYQIDFNRAYHPYCYYNPTYDCPFPPPENRLPIAVRAGERLKR